MKKILFILICTIVMLCVSPLTCLAAEGADVAEEITWTVDELEVETVYEEATALTDMPTQESNDASASGTTTTHTIHTLYTRVCEYFVEHKVEILGLAGDAVIFILAILVKFFNDKRTKSIESDLKFVKGDFSRMTSSQTSVVGAVNNMIAGYNGMRESYEKYENAEADRNRLVGAVMVQNTALLEILSTVYVNSKNLPQGVKDLVNLKYANCLKALGDDEMLCAIVESVREKVGIAVDEKEKEEAETEAEAKEETETAEV